MRICEVSQPSRGLLNDENGGSAFHKRLDLAVYHLGESGRETERWLVNQKDGTAK